MFFLLYNWADLARTPPEGRHPHSSLPRGRKKVIFNIISISCMGKETMACEEEIKIYTRIVRCCRVSCVSGSSVELISPTFLKLPEQLIKSSLQGRILDLIA